MTHIPLFLLTALFFIIPGTNQENLLNQAQDELFVHQSISYNVTGFYPNPMGDIDTIEVQSAFLKNEKSLIDYDLIIKGKISDVVIIDGVYNSIDHASKSVELYPEDESDKLKFFIDKNRFIAYSPLTLLSRTDWEYVSDTLVDEIKLSDFYRVENDTIVEGNTIYTEAHIYINPVSKLLERVERRNYFNGKMAQNVVFTYEDYIFDQAGESLTYNYPEGYTSVLSGQRGSSPLPEVGDEAPVFIGKDLNNKTVNLLDLRGKKVLLDFSVINCGYCKLVLEHFNHEEYKLSDNLQALYINPLDKEGDVMEYVSKMNVQFPAIPNAKDIGELYGVSGYPIFFLIDENGIIEKVSAGYDKEFLASLQNL